MDTDSSGGGQRLSDRIRQGIIGKPLDISKPSIFHKLSLIPLLAWIGLGADGLSSSSYGPEEGFRAIGSHPYLAVFLGLATAFTVIVIAYSYSRIIEHFPHGGGGYIVATHTINENVGVISGCALLVDYMLTITVSLVACSDAIFSFLPLSFLKYRIAFTVLLILFLVILNLRGVKESVLILTPVFAIFIITHVLLIGYGILGHTDRFVPMMYDVRSSLRQDLSAIGFVGIASIFLRAFSLGGGTYTGLEAVSNGMQIMREPKVHNGKKTMFYMAASLAFTACGLFFCYYIFRIAPVEGRTFNAVLADGVFGRWPLGYWIAFVTILSEGILLMVAAQAGFIDGPRVMANMAIDSWLPRRFAALSERLSMQNGVLLMGLSAFVLLFYTHGSVAALIVMYSINVFLTFSLSQFGMIRFYVKIRRQDGSWRRHVPVHVVGLLLCVTILVVTVYEKFGEGGWVTLLITAVIVALCYLIRGHYRKVRASVRQLEDILTDIPPEGPYNNEPVDPGEMTAVLLVSGFNGFGLHTLLSIVRNFPGVYRNFIFASVGEVDSGSFKGIDEMEALKASVRDALGKYVKVCRQHGFPADFRMEVGIDVIDMATHIVESVVREFPRSTVFTGKLVFRNENPFQRILHNESAYAIQRRLQWAGVPSVILPIRVNM